MPRKLSSPKLHSSKINFGQTIGIGQIKGEARAVLRAKIIDPSGKVFSAAAKRTPKHLDVSEEYRRKHVLRAQIAWRAFKRAGLPVPSFSRVFLLKNNPNYLTVFMQDMKKKYGHLEDGHKAGHPEFLNNFSVKNNSELIKNLAHDLATMHNLGITSEYLDFWHFYKKRNGAYERVILDFNSFVKEANPLHLTTSLADKLVKVQDNMGKAEYLLFKNEVKRVFKDKNKSWDFIEEYIKHANEIKGYSY